MPVEPLEPLDTDDFANDLGGALRATADTFAPEDPLTLVNHGHLRGRRMRRRRTVGVVAGATVLATVAVGGVAAGAWLDGDGSGGRQSGVASASHPGWPGGASLYAALVSMAPPGVRAEPAGAAAWNRGGAAEVTLATHGSSTKNLLVLDFGQGASPGSYPYTCQSNATKRWGWCFLSRDAKGKLPHTWTDKGRSRAVVGTQTKVKGGTVTVYRTVAKPGQHPVTVLAVFEGHGYEAHVAETPLGRGKKPNPTSFVNKLTDAQLISIVTDKRWEKFAKSMPRVNPTYRKAGGTDAAAAAGLAAQGH